MGSVYDQLVQKEGGKYKRIICHTLSTDFRKSTSIVEERFPTLLGDKQVVVKSYFLGINASDINFTNGRYDPTKKPPFPCGFECVGRVEAVGTKVNPKNVKVGDAVAIIQYGAFSEFMVVHEKSVVKVPFLSKNVLPTLVCGATASIALDEIGEMYSSGRGSETVLVTAAAGATGQFAVQLAKLAGHIVIGTCSSEEKVRHLRSLGCDRVINYKKENMKHVLRTEYPRGVDIVFESVGGTMFQTAVDCLAPRGRLIVIGAISGYQDNTAWETQKQPSHKSSAGSARKGKGGGGGTPLPTKLLAKSASIRGFFLNHFNDKIPFHTQKMSSWIRKGLLQPGVDPTSFVGLEGVPNAIDYMYSRKNIGKVIVSLQHHQLPPATSRNNCPMSRL